MTDTSKRDEMTAEYVNNWAIPNTISDAEKHALVGAFKAGWDARKSEIKELNRQLEFYKSEAIREIDKNKVWAPSSPTPEAQRSDQALNEEAYRWLNANGFYRFDGSINFSNLVCIFKAGSDFAKRESEARIISMGAIHMEDRHKINQFEARIKELEHCTNVAIKMNAESLEKITKLEQALAVATKAIEFAMKGPRWMEVSMQEFLEEINAIREGKEAKGAGDG